MERIGKYDILRTLGEGATSTVYLGHDAFARREVAIKVPFPALLADRERGNAYRRLLLNEASLAGKLRHPHIVQIFDAVVEPALSYVVMEYVPGGTLDQFAYPGALLPVERVVEIVFKCTRALDHAFRQGVTHRDIKPANILFASPAAPAADIKISDFGAALISASERTQVSGVGSPAYMSPQQLHELPLDHQTDIYSLGVVMYQLLTGRLPFQGSNNYSVVRQILAGTPPAPSTLRREVPASLDAVVARAMQREPELRYATWDEFSHDLSQAFRNTRLQARCPGLAESEKFQMLRALALLRDFTDVVLWELVHLGDWELLAPGTVVMKEGEPGDWFAVLLAGEVRVRKRGRLLNTLGAGECFGELSIIHRSGGRRGADVVTVAEARILRIGAQTLRRASEALRMHFYRAFLDVVAARLLQANARLVAV
ncbi:MAG: protein kinase [Betaproteobacteria bacterium]|nr:protein kinase [Betaproteobacteria bacterium]